MIRIFKEKIVEDKNIVFSCGSGLTACIVMLAYEIAIKKNRCIYDGSWSEWAQLHNLEENV